MQKQSVLPTQDSSTLPAGTRGFVCTDGRVFPLYRALPDDLKKGMYFALFDGRKDASAVFLEQGYDGPVFGPLHIVVRTGKSIVLQFVDVELSASFMPEMEKQLGADGGLKATGKVTFIVEDGLIEFDGHFFGAREVFDHGLCVEEKA